MFTEVATMSVLELSNFLTGTMEFPPEDICELQSKLKGLKGLIFNTTIPNFK